MPTLEQIEDQVRQLTKAEQEALRDWLENMLEDELEFTDEFKAKIERGEQDIREGRVRVRKPEPPFDLSFRFGAKRDLSVGDWPSPRNLPG